MAMVDAWAVSQDDQPGRSEAIRRLVELGLTVKAPGNFVGECRELEHASIVRGRGGAVKWQIALRDS